MVSPSRSRLIWVVEGMVIHHVRKFSKTGLDGVGVVDRRRVGTGRATAIGGLQRSAFIVQLVPLVADWANRR